jgi:hypothetical protein
MLVKESSDLALQLSCVVQLAHGNGVFKEFTLDVGRQIVPLHDDCGTQAPQNMFLFLGEATISGLSVVAHTDRVDDVNISQLYEQMDELAGEHSTT